MENVGELCQRDPVTARPADTMEQVALRMHQHQVGCLVVVHEEDAGRVVGIVTDRDLVVRGVAHGARAVTQVHNLMTEDVVTCRAFDTIPVALRRMERAGIRRMPVLDGADRLVGVVALEDLLEHVADELSCIASLSRNERRREATGA